MENSVKCLIMAGGSGVRFWPKSRIKNPKQLQKFFFTNSLLKETINRVRFTDFKNIVVACSKDIKESVFEIHKNIIIEPAPRNTAPCIAYASLKLQTSVDDIMVVLPSDQYIKETNLFNDIINKAINFASKNDYIVSLGIKPSSAHTGYGYIEAGENINSDILYINNFKEKPNLETANEFLKSGNYFWNAGIFIFKISVFIEALKNHMPTLFNETKLIVDKNDDEFFKNEFPKLKSESVDYGIMEKITNRACILADFYWDDLGSWDSIEKYYDDFENGKTNTKLVSALNSNNIFINQYNKNKLTTVIGLDDIVVVDTKDALLITKKSDSQKIKNLHEKLKAENLNEYL